MDRILSEIVSLQDIQLSQHGCIFSTFLPDNCTCLHKNRHSGFPRRGKTGISQPQARARKDETPAPRFARSE